MSQNTSRDLNRRSTFNSHAKLYQAIRPQYPEVLFEALIEVTQLSPAARLLEIGPGTGQATEPLARRGYTITAVELGAELAAVAKRSLAAYKNVEIITGAFEEVELPEKSFDLVYSATAFHWIKPEVKFAKPHALLKDNGYLAILYTGHVSDEAEDLFLHAVQPAYQHYIPDRDEDFSLPRLSELEPAMVDETLFKQVYFKAFPMAITYTAEKYTQLLSTYSPIIALTPEKRGAFLQEIANIINQQFNGQIIKHYGMMVTIAQKID